MDLNRAQQILASEDKIDVQLEGEKVWIESIDTNRLTAQVHLEGSKADTRNVSLEQLQEL